MKIQIDLTPDEDKIVQTYKLMRGFLTKEESIKEIIKLNGDRKSTRLNSSHIPLSRMPSSA